MELLAILWIVGLVVYFGFTTARQRENLLLLSWAILLSPIAVWGAIALTR